MKKPTAYEVYLVAKMLCDEQTCHPSNANDLEHYVPIAIQHLRDTEKEIERVFNEKS
jgi:hypothetical protein